MTNKIISIGSEHNEYLAFGDDSQFKDTLAYSFIVIHSDKLEFVQSRIKRIKKIYGIPEHVIYFRNCSFLFNFFKKFFSITHK